MGHRIQILTYNPYSENNAIKVIQYLALLNLHGNTHNYHYKLWCPTTKVSALNYMQNKKGRLHLFIIFLRNYYKTYIRNSQTFQRYPAEYPWNQFDNLICGDLKKELSGGTRFRRLNYRIIPDQFKDASSELEYLKKFKRFLEYGEIEQMIVSFFVIIIAKKNIFSRKAGATRSRNSAKCKVE
jgi:hypothetical protein